MTIAPADAFTTTGLLARWGRERFACTADELFAMQIAFDGAAMSTQVNVATMIEQSSDGLLLQFLNVQRAADDVNGLIPIGWTSGSLGLAPPAAQEDIYKAVVVATSPITLSGMQLIDGYTTEPFDRVLVVNQADSTQDGLWLAQIGGWFRPADFPPGEAVEGTFIVISGGDDFAGTIWVLTGTSPTIVDFSEQNWTETGGGGGDNGTTIALASVQASIGQSVLGTVLTGQPIVDGYQTQVGDRILVGGQGTGGSLSATNNGVWVVTPSGPWLRPADFNTGRTFNGATVLVLGGQYRAGTIWACTSTSPLTVDSSLQSWGNTAHTEPGTLYMTDYLEEIDFNNPWTDPSIAYGNAVESLPFYTWYRHGGPLTYRRGTIHWPQGDFIARWTTNGGSGEANSQARSGGAFSDPGPLVRTIGAGMDLTRVVSAAPKIFARSVNHGGDNSASPAITRAAGKWDSITLDGSFSLGGSTGYMIDAGEQMRISDMAIRNFGPCPAPILSTSTVAGSTLQAGAWGIVVTVAGSVSTSGWAGTGYVGWADPGNGYTGGPTESQISSEQQMYVTAGQGLGIQVPTQMQTPTPPWGYNIYARPICQVDASTPITTLSGFTGTGCNLVVNSATPPTGSTWLTGGAGTLSVIATPSGGGAVPGWAKITYTAISGNTFQNCNFHSSGSTVGSTATIATGNIITGPTYQQIAANVAAGTQASPTVYEWSTAWSQSALSLNPPTSLGWLSTNLYLTGGNNAASDSSGWNEKTHLRMELEGGGCNLVIDGTKNPGTGSTSFEYCHFELDLYTPPGCNGIVATNSAWLGHDQWEFGTNFNESYDGNGYTGAITTPGSGAVGMITYQCVAGTVYGGCIVQAIEGAFFSDSGWFERLEGDNPSANSGYAANWLQSATVTPIRMLVDTANGSCWFNMTGQVDVLDGTMPTPIQAIPGGTGLTWSTGPASNGAISFTGPVHNDTKLISLGGKSGSGPVALAVDWQSVSSFPVWQA